MVGPDEEVVWSCDDLQGALVLLGLPRSWAPLFAFNVTIQARELGCPEWEGPAWLGAIAMPMGYKSAMGRA